MRVPQSDPGAGFRAHQAAIEAAIARVLASGSYILGPEVAAFEAEFAVFLGGGHVVACANGTDAIELALRAHRIGPGAAVATVSHTAVATVAAIERAGAVPCLVDIDPETYTLDVADLAELIAARDPAAVPLRAVIAVHLYGQAADLARLGALCRQHDLVLIEDVAQAHGARADGRMLGTIGDAGTFSFYPTKNLGALGDGGALWVRDADSAARVTALRQYGWDADRVSRVAGQNSRMDTLQAAILRARLPHLSADNGRRRAIAARYDAALADRAVTIPTRRPDAEHVFHQYVVRSRDRDGLRAHLAAAGIGTAIHYPLPVHLHPAYRGRIALGPANCATSVQVAGEVLSLPMYPEMEETMLAAVIARLREVIAPR